MVRGRVSAAGITRQSWQQKVFIEYVKEQFHFWTLSFFTMGQKQWTKQDLKIGEFLFTDFFKLRIDNSGTKTFNKFKSLLLYFTMLN